MKRPGALAIMLGFACGLGLGCVDRQFEIDESESEELPTCLTISGYGHWNDGRHHALSNEDGRASTVCMCMTWDEQQELGLYGEKETFIEHEINAMALEECERVAGLYGSDWNDCQTNYEAGNWRSGLSFAVDERANRNQQGLTCGEGTQDTELSCALGSGRPSAGWLLVLAGLFGVFRRSKTTQGPRSPRASR